jgi:hypothetical protein
MAYPFVPFCCVFVNKVLLGLHPSTKTSSSMFDWPFEAVTVGFQTQWKKQKNKK